MEAIYKFLNDYKELLAAAGALLTFIWGVYQYVNAQRWKSAEFALHELKEFNQHPNTALMQKFLDFSAIRLTLSLEGKTFEATITDERLIWHLRPHTVDGRLSTTDMAVRQAFDTYFLELEKFEYLIRIGLMDKNALHPYLAYWLDILGRKRKGRKDPETIKAIHNYIHFYGQKGVAKLMRRFGYFSLYDSSVKYEKTFEETEPA